jgi:hypothetical protein
MAAFNRFDAPFRFEDGAVRTLLGIEEKSQKPKGAKTLWRSLRPEHRPPAGEEDQPVPPR